MLGDNIDWWVSEKGCLPELESFTYIDRRWHNHIPFCMEYLMPIIIIEIIIVLFRLFFLFLGMSLYA